MSFEGDLLRAGIVPDLDGNIMIDGDITSRNSQGLASGYTSQIWYVDSDISTSGNGKSWNRAFKTITEALAAADDHDVILIQKGIYDEGAVLNITQEGLRMFGMGTSGDIWGNTTIKASAANHICITVNANEVEIGNLAFVQNNANVVISVATTKSTYKTHIHDCYFGGSSTQTVGVSGSYSGTYDSVDVLVERCTFYQCVTGVDLNGTRCTVRGNVFLLSASDTAIEVSQSAGNRPELRILNNTIRGANDGDTGIKFAATPTEALFTMVGNVVENCATPVTAALYTSWYDGNHWGMDDASYHSSTPKNYPTGKVFHCDSGATSTGLDGRSKASAFKTLAEAVAACTANQGDTILLEAGHAETLSEAAAINLNVAGIYIIGLGKGADRPTFTFSETDATITITAASTYLSNVILKPSTDSVVSPIVVSAANCTVDVEVEDLSDTVEFVRGLLTTAAADDLTVKMRYLGRTGGDACENAIRLVGCDRARIHIDFYGKASTAVVEFYDTTCTDVIVSGKMYVSGTTDSSKDVVDTAGSSTWYMQIWDGSAGSEVSGGSGNAVAPGDLSAMATAIATVNTDLSNETDGLGALKTLIEAISTDSPFLASVGGALDDAAAEGAVTEEDTIMQYTKQLVTNSESIVDKVSGIDPISGNVYYVDKLVAESGDGLSMATAFKTIAEAVTAVNALIDWGAQPWGTNTTIYVNIGKYDENLTSLPYGAQIIGMGSARDINGENGVTIQPASGSPIDCESVINCTIKNICFHSPVDSGTEVLFQVDNLNRAIIEDCVFQGVPGASPTTVKGLEVVKDMTGSVVRRCLFNQIRNGIYLVADNANEKQITGDLFEDIIITGADQVGIYFDVDCVPSNTVIKNCIIGDNGTTLALGLDDNTGIVTVANTNFIATANDPATGSGKYNNCYLNGELQA